jgi:L-arabinose isomerase
MLNPGHPKRLSQAAQSQSPSFHPDNYILHVTNFTMVEMKSLQPKIGLATIASPNEVGADKVEQLHKKAVSALSNAGLQVVPGREIVDSDDDGARVGHEIASKEPDAICVLYGTYADDTYATTVLEQSNVPAIIWGVNDFDSGSIGGAQQLSAVLTEIDQYYKLVFGNVDDGRTINEIVTTARVATARKMLRASRIGVIGYQRIRGQTQAAFDEIELHERIGCRIVGVSMHLFRELMAKVGESQAQEMWPEISRGVKKVSVNGAQIADGVKAYLAMRRIVHDMKLDAVAIEDWFDMIGIPNLGLSLLNEEGIPAGCESDVHSTLTLYLLKLFTGRPAFHGELLGILEEEDALLVAHYGAGAPSLAASREEIRFEPDRSSGRGVSVVYQVKPGPVTVASLTGRRGSYRMFIANGESIRAREVFHGGVVASVRFRCPHNEVLRKARGMSHHWLLGIGDVSRELIEYCEMVRIKTVVV